MDRLVGRDIAYRWLAGGVPVTSLFGGTEAASGIVVTPDTAMRATAVYACVQYLARSIPAMPLILYRRLPDGGKERDGEHPLGHLLHDRQSAFEFR